MPDPGAQLAGLGLFFPFLKIEKNALILGKKGPDCVHFWVKFSIQNVILRISKRKKSKMFLCFFVFLTKCLLKYPSSTKPPLP